MTKHIRLVRKAQVGSPLLQAVENNRSTFPDASQTLFKKAEKKAAHLQKALDKSRRLYGAGSNVAQIQSNLYNEGWFDKGVSYNQAVSGVLDKNTRIAEDRKKYDEEDSNSQDNIVKRTIGSGVTTFLNNLFPYGYDNSKVTEAVQSVIPVKKVGQAAGALYKFWHGLTGSDKAGNAARELADLDLTKPENRERAGELIEIIKEDEPKWGLTSKNPETWQTSLRARYDLNLLHGGLRQKYNTFSKATGYTTKTGDRTYGYNNPQMQKMEQAYIKNYIKEHTPSRQTEDGQYIWSIDGGDPFTAHGRHTIYASDRQGTNARIYDEWDFDIKDYWSSNDLLGTKKIKVGIKAE